MNKTIHQYIYEEISYLLNHLNLIFEKDELAYYSLQGKNEQQVRDKIAWKLQCLLDEHYEPSRYLVRREWSDSGRSKVDLAVLEIDKEDTNKSTPLALFEFKAHQSMDNNKWFYAAFVEDVKKMYEMCNKDQQTLKNCQLYFIHLQGVLGKYPDSYKQAVVYWDERRNKHNIYCDNQEGVENKKKEIHKAFHSNEELYNVYKPHYKRYYGKDLPEKLSLIEYNEDSNCKKQDRWGETQDIGSSFGYGYDLIPYIWGPYVIDESNVNDSKKGFPMYIKKP